MDRTNIQAREARVILLLTLDYELFFGRSTGSPEKCLLEPTSSLLQVLDKHGVKTTLFVDAGYLVRMRDLGQPELETHWKLVVEQLQNLVRDGHDVQIHIHPHWENSTWNGEWHIDDTHYRLHDFPAERQVEIVRSYVDLLTEIAGRRPVAYRAGGWCIQPFSEIHPALANCGICVDSTVYARGHSANAGREFDFRGAPDDDYWRFSADPLMADPEGDFLELAISSVNVSPVFYWGSVIRRLLNNPRDRKLGDGSAMTGGSRHYGAKLLSSTAAVASVDGDKARLLRKAYQRAKRAGHALFNVMGHPKALTENSLSLLDDLLTSTPFEHHTIHSLLESKALDRIS